MNGTLLLDSVPVDRPGSLEEALSLLATAKTRPVVLAGGTDLMVAFERGLLTPETVLDISRLDELRKIEEGPDGMAIGALATYSEILEHSATPAALLEAAKTVGARQIQNRGTMGGNVANGSPAGDTLPVLLALDAEVEVASLRGARRIPFKDFHTGYRATSMAPDEIIIRIHVPKPAKHTTVRFRKVGTRRAQAISKVVFCGRARLAKKRKVEDIRLAVGSVAPTVIRLLKTEEALRERPLTKEAIERARLEAREEVLPIDDVRSTAAYRRMVTGNLVARFLMNVRGGG